MGGQAGADRCQRSPAPEGRREEGTAEAGAGVYLSGGKSLTWLSWVKGLPKFPVWKKMLLMLVAEIFLRMCAWRCEDKC